MQMEMFGTCSQPLCVVCSYWEKSIEIYDTFAEYGKEQNTLKYSISLRKLKTLAGNEICVSFEIQ